MSAPQKKFSSKAPRAKVSPRQPLGVTVITALALFSLATFFAFTQSPRPNPFVPATLWEKFFYPREQNAFMRLPVITGDLNDVFALPGSKLVWAVGDRGLIIHSSDGGETWAQQTFPGGSEIAPVDAKQGASLWERVNPVHEAHAEKAPVELPPETGISNQAQPTLDTKQEGKGAKGARIDSGETKANLKTEEPEVIEDVQPPNPPSPFLSSVVFSDQNTGITVGERGTVLNTTDGGESWLPNILGTRTWLNAIALDESGGAIAVGSGGFIVRNSDGKTWQAVGSKSFAALNGIAITEDGRGIGVGERGTILNTTDGGKSWLLNKAGGSDVDLYAIALNKSGGAIAVGWGGTILKSSDGGNYWRTKTSGTEVSLSDVDFTNDTVVIVVGLSGTILKSSDGGDSWEAMTSGTKASLAAITSIDSRRLIAVGSDGTILKSKNGGESWYPVTRGSKLWLQAVRFADETTSVSLNDKGDVVKSLDGGESWAEAEYRRYPSILYWSVCLFFALFALGVATRQRGEQPRPTETVADILASDRPLRPGDPDPLDFGAIARGLSRFMRNPSTEPPLTVAITGAWGTGKSSLMNLLYHDLKHYGFSPVWFNAWHHQKGEQLLASLAANIRSQAVPGWLKFSGSTPVGLLFRLNLFFRRSTRHWLLTLMLIILGIAAGTYVFKTHNGLDGFTITALLGLFQDNADYNKLIVALLGGLPPIAAFLRSLRAFGINPASLIAKSAANTESASRIDPSARSRFAKEFNDVTESLELGRMVIFIDDLDRCSKENVVDILESINFLSVSGNCYIILGMDEGWVKACIEEHFPEMTNTSHQFAEEYLEKMINIKVPVPILEEEGSGKLLAPDPPKELSAPPWQKFQAWIRGRVARYRYLLLLAPLGIAGAAIGYNFDKIYKTQAPAVKELSEIRVWENVDIEDIDVVDGRPSLLMNIGAGRGPQNNPAATDGVDRQSRDWQLVLRADEKAMAEGVLIGHLGDGEAEAELLLRLAAKKSEGKPVTARGESTPVLGQEDDKTQQAVEVRPGQTDDSRISYLLPGVIILFIVLGLLVYLLRRPGRIVRDSPKFREALMIWQPWIMLNRQTPRAIKRYLNRVRYIAMRYRGEEDEGGKTILAKLFKRGASPDEGKAAEIEAIDEPSIVALSSIFAVDEGWLIDGKRFNSIHQGDLSGLLKEKYPDHFPHPGDTKEAIDGSNELAAFVKPLNGSIEDHKQAFGDGIFTSNDLRNKFLKILAAVRIN